MSIWTALFLNMEEASVQINNEILSRTETPMVSLFVALASGLAAAFAWARPKLSASLPGVAVATALLPPLAVAGIGIAFFQKTMIFGGLQLFSANLLIIILASSMVFSLFGFFTARKEEEKKLKEEIKEIKEEKKEIVQEIKQEEIKKEKIEKEIEKKSATPKKRSKRKTKSKK
jgi:uncharacterized membrane protein